MEKILVNYNFENAVAVITLNDGSGNILDHIMIDEIQLTLEALKKERHLKLIMFEGQGKHFSFGASVKEHQKEYAESMLHQLHRLFYTILDLSIPCAAKINGQCLGGGFELALMCHFIFAEKNARFGQPEIMLGVFPPAGSLVLPEKVGYARAEELLITGRVFNADEAHKIGLLTSVFEDRVAMEKGVNTWIKENILPKSAVSLRHAVSAARVKFNHVFRNFMPQLETQYVKNLMATHDANEGINSFLEKRVPVWEDR